MDFIYAERWISDEAGELTCSQIVCLSIAQFVPYRIDGYAGCPEHNAAADAMIAADARIASMPTCEWCDDERPAVGTMEMLDGRRGYRDVPMCARCIAAVEGGPQD